MISKNAAFKSLPVYSALNSGSIYQIIVIAIVVLQIPLLTGKSFAVDDNFPQGARPGGMGNAYITLGEDAGGMYYNPAGLMLLNGISAEVFMGSPGMPFPENWSIFYAKPAIVGDRIGTGMIHQVRQINDRTYRSYQLILPTTLAVTERILTGLNVKLVTQKSGNLSFKSKASADYGMIYNRGIFRMGLVIRDFIDPGMSSFPTTWVTGASLNFTFLKLELDQSVSEWDEFEFDDKNIRVGIEINPMDVFSMRAGIDRTGIQEMRTAGFSISDRIGSVSLEYCIQFYDEDFENGTHWISYNYLIY